MDPQILSPPVGPPSGIWILDFHAIRSPVTSLELALDAALHQVRCCSFCRHSGFRILDLRVLSPTTIVPVTICARLFPSKPWVHTSFKTRLQHKQRTIVQSSGRLGFRRSSKKSWLGLAMSTADIQWLRRRQGWPATTVSGGSGCILGRYGWVRRDTPSAPRAHMLRSNPKRGLHGRRRRY